MRTRRYSFKASGTIEDVTQAALTMKDSLNKGPGSIIQSLYGEFGTKPDKDTVDKVEFVLDSGNLSAVEVSTYDWLQKDRKADIKACLQAAADKTGENISIDGNMKYAATDENLPEYFYHLTERAQLDSILEEGLAPKRGHNDWKSKKRCTYLTEDRFIVPWLGILKELDDPVVLEVDTAKLPSVEQGRLWEDRDYVPGRVYSEHRTTETVPVDALRVMSPEEVTALGVNEKAIGQLMSVASQKPSPWHMVDGVPVRPDEAEVKRCMDRLKEMGVMDGQTYDSAMEAYESQAAVVEFSDFTKQVTAIETSVDEELPFN